MDLSLEGRVLNLLKSGQKVVLITIIKSEGSAPRHVGTRALQTEAGFEGTVGGGILEAKTMELARESLATGISRRATFNLKASPSSDMLCGGSIEVACEVLTSDHLPEFAKAEKAINLGIKGLWVIDLKGNLENPVFERKFFADKERPPLEVPSNFKGLLREGEAEKYLEPLNPPSILLLCGGGHVALEVARLAYACDFVIEVVDDREEFANAKRFPWARKCYVLPNFANLRSVCQVSSNHYVAIMTRGHAYDRTVLEQILAEPTKYVGMIGSKTKRAKIYEYLFQLGISKETLEQVCCPIGLSLKAETPEQIAVSVVAELLAARGEVLSRFRPKEGILA
ncbi:MAG: XdhC family protein [Desulfovibrionaceae bacterium]|nr:XdhC family protein [Desulfovibrionaceae bacterium]